MKFAKHFLLTLLVSGLMALPGFAQTSSSSNQSSDQTAAQSGQMPNPKASNGKYASGDTAAESNKESSDRFATDKQGRNGMSAMSDQEFIKKAAEDDIAEVQMTKLAEQKATDNNIKQMAQHLMNDHQQNEQQIKQVAQQQGVTLPTQPSAKDQAKYDRLSKLNGQAFDKAFLREQLKDHKKDVALFQHEQSSAKDQAVKSYASQTLPTLQQHLQMAQSAAQQMGVSAKGGRHHKGQQSASTNQPER